MKTRHYPLSVLFCLVMIIFVLFIVWYLPSVGSLRFRLDDIGKSIETSLGRERKQQKEYDQAVSAIPEVQEEIERIKPLAEAAEEEVSTLKAERKNLRVEKKELEAQKDSSGNGEVSGNE